MPGQTCLWESDKQVSARIIIMSASIDRWHKYTALHRHPQSTNTDKEKDESIKKTIFGKVQWRRHSNHTKYSQRPGRGVYRTPPVHKSLADDLLGSHANKTVRQLRCPVSVALRHTRRRHPITCGLLLLCRSRDSMWFMCGNSKEDDECISTNKEL